MKPATPYPLDYVLLLGLALAAASACAATPDEQRSRLAKERGCTFCHAFEPGSAAAGAALPPAPAFSDITARYRGQPGAEDKLVAVVMRGSSAKDRHWAGHVTGGGMPANPVEISEEDARRLIRWLLR